MILVRLRWAFATEIGFFSLGRFCFRRWLATRGMPNTMRAGRRVMFWSWSEKFIQIRIEFLRIYKSKMRCVPLTKFRLHTVCMIVYKLYIIPHIYIYINIWVFVCFYIYIDLYDNPKFKHMSSCMYRWAFNILKLVVVLCCIPAVF